jgi:hypothetical protein
LAKVRAHRKRPFLNLRRLGRLGWHVASVQPRISLRVARLPGIRFACVSRGKMKQTGGVLIDYDVVNLEIALRPTIRLGQRAGRCLSQTSRTQCPQTPRSKCSKGAGSAFNPGGWTRPRLCENSFRMSATLRSTSQNGPGSTIAPSGIPKRPLKTRRFRVFTHSRPLADISRARKPPSKPHRERTLVQQADYSEAQGVEYRVQLTQVI